MAVIKPDPILQCDRCSTTNDVSEHPLIITFNRQELRQYTHLCGRCRIVIENAIDTTGRIRTEPRKPKTAKVALRGEEGKEG